MKWDGSYLGEFPTNIITKTCKFNNERYVVLSIEGEEIYAHIRVVEDNVSCVIDELKPIFKLRKLGTHTIKIYRNLYLLIRVNPKIVDGEYNFVEEPSINKVDIKPIDNSDFRREIQKIVIFRELLGIPPTGKNIIRVRDSDYGPFPLSYIDKEFDFSDHKITVKLYRKWFGDSSINDVLPGIIGYDGNQENIVKLTADLRNDIEDVIMRINKNYIWAVSSILRRVVDRLLG